MQKRSKLVRVVGILGGFGLFGVAMYKSLLVVTSR